MLSKFRALLLFSTVGSCEKMDETDVKTRYRAVKEFHYRAL